MGFRRQSKKPLWLGNHRVFLYHECNFLFQLKVGLQTVRTPGDHQMAFTAVIHQLRGEAIHRGGIRAIAEGNLVDIVFTRSAGCAPDTDLAVEQHGPFTLTGTFEPGTVFALGHGDITKGQIGRGGEGGGFGLFRSPAPNAITSLLLRSTPVGGKKKLW